MSLSRKFKRSRKKNKLKKESEQGMFLKISLTLTLINKRSKDSLKNLTKTRVTMTTLKPIMIIGEWKEIILLDQLLELLK